MPRFIPLLFLLIACGDGVPTTPETRPVDNPNAGNTAIYDVDPDDPYEIGDGAFLDMRPGGRLANFAEVLQRNTVGFSGESSAIYSIYGRQDERLGFVRGAPADSLLIGEIVITSRDVVTEDGLRVGYSYAEMVERIGAVEIIEAPMTGRVYASKDGLFYLLNAESKQVANDATIEQIIIGR